MISGEVCCLLSCRHDTPSVPIHRGRRLLAFRISLFFSEEAAHSDPIDSKQEDLPIELRVDLVLI